MHFPSSCLRFGPPTNHIVTEGTHHKDQADGAQLISLWEYFRRAAERTSRQEEQAAEQLSPFWGTSLAVPLPGTGPLRYGPVRASSAYHRQLRRRRAPVPDSVAGRGDAPAPCSTGGPHDAQHQVLELDRPRCLASLRRSAQLRHPHPQHPQLLRLISRLQQLRLSSSHSQRPLLSHPHIRQLQQGFRLGFPPAQDDIVTLTAASAEPSSHPPAAARMTSSPEGSRHWEDSGGRLLCFHGGSTRHGYVAAVFPGVCGRISSALCWSPLVAWVLAGLQLANRECMRERCVECVPHLMAYPQDLPHVHSILQAEFLEEGWLDAPAPLSAGGPFTPLLEAVAAAGSPGPQPATAGSSGSSGSSEQQPAASGSSEPQPAAAGSSEPQPAAAGSSEQQPATGGSSRATACRRRVF
ncbi:hypothetical protein CRENBAI_018432 [Crenichthys baileyi]|uniref:Uncharacterized protein n=1 Tax=Crenichthys baileyi TaxID=28760 RepID=A0AAV9SNW5_9TELE